MVGNGTQTEELWGKNGNFFPEKNFKRVNHCFIRILDEEVHSDRKKHIFKRQGKEGPDGFISEFYQTCKKDIV